MLSTPNSSAARHARRISSTVVACGWSCTPTLQRGATNRTLAELDPAAAVGEDERHFTLEQFAEWFTHEFGAPAGSEPARFALQQLREFGAGCEQRGVEIEFGGTLREPRAEHRY